MVDVVDMVVMAQVAQVLLLVVRQVLLGHLEGVHRHVVVGHRQHCHVETSLLLVLNVALGCNELQRVVSLNVHVLEMQALLAEVLGAIYQRLRCTSTTR